MRTGMAVAGGIRSIEDGEDVVGRACGEGRWGRGERC